MRFIEVSDGPKFRTELHQALREGLTALGLLGWEVKKGTLRAKAVMFPWHDESLGGCSSGCVSRGLQELFQD